jgi:hypothetical protein
MRVVTDRMGGCVELELRVLFGCVSACLSTF